MRPISEVSLLSALLCGLLACGQGEPGPPGPAGPPGDPGTGGANGATGENGANGSSSAPDGGDLQAPDSPPPLTDGTRIKARTATVTTTTTTSDGAKTVTSYQQSSWFDSLRNEPCTFVAAGDDKVRCLPTALALTDYSSGLYFQDASCTQAVAFTIKQTPSSCGGTTIPAPPTPKYIIFSKSGATCGGRGVKPLGSLLSTGATIYIKSGANCIASSASAAYDYFSSTVEIPPSEFVESSTTTVTTY